ncbi:RraA family protein [Lentzea flaviverrucosa]|uniref:Putative 4-hydroxy-4-methyl-2-oxoglutarate aldolase n=1 Tax=Lentzea flaviverrucosa TaxID=200379 RepID=A0A1H9AVL2_9PSEU|nr:dimethylmenaquinone methyltransferase [Lentzea flaviverrucosa]RDI31952.1 regulator of RNase E activity RraA [Lentzea flaviverrucosa]SEP80842.1 Regulator of RNase E activity RraA [Lentzea flaviverrucosa]
MDLATLDLTTAHLADACIRADIPVRTVSLTPVIPGSKTGGRVLPARHAGSVDVFLEAIERSEPGDVLVVDNDARTDEACVGDLIVLEAQKAGLAGVVIWGLHRDTQDIRAIGLPVFSLGANPTGPLSLRDRAPEALSTAEIGQWTVTSDDIVFGDDDGVLFVPASHAGALIEKARGIRDVERAQADRVRQGESLRGQLRFGEYLESGLTFREHLRKIGGAVEE